MDHMHQLTERIEKILHEKDRAFVAIDGMAASGKTTLAAALHKHFDRCAVVHMDDFTIPLDARTPGYFKVQLSNADLSRFDREVLSPLLSGKDASYRPYICHPVPGFLNPVHIDADIRVLIVEGAYCLHPQLFERYDLRVLSLIDAGLQRERIRRRSGAAQLGRFDSLWIPMEMEHIEAHHLRALCDVTLFTDQAP